MKVRVHFAFACIAFSACKFSTDTQGTSDQKAFQAELLAGGSLGLQPGEFALTLDDGPSVYTEKLVRFLIKEDVPATFFILGQKEGASTKIAEALKRTPELKNLWLTTKNNERQFLIANHTADHEFDAGSIKELARQIATTHEVLENNGLFAGDEAPYFFRHPGGNWGWDWGSRAEVANALNEVSGGKLKQYIGPIQWNVSGDTAPNCTTPSRLPECKSIYLARMKQWGKGIILNHDIHPTTLDLLMGNATMTGLIADAKKLGYKFVSLKAHPDAIKKLE
jgi:peptidoglycan/xylan/chitin deacetylase (PgdA/CDA1 family)